jgi:DNA invertase Pin-like site-specific DNA recombinase
MELRKAPSSHRPAVRNRAIPGHLRQPGMAVRFAHVSLSRNPCKQSTSYSPALSRGCGTPPRMGHLLGYARVSTTDQHLHVQVDALTAAGCYRVFTETASGARADRPVLAQVLDQLRPGDTLVVWKLDRLGRSLRHLVDTITGLADQGVGVRSLQEAIDTTTPGGKLVFHVFAALAEFERDLIRERTAAGLAAARTRGRNGGRPAALDDGQVELARELYASRRYTTAEIARRLKVGRQHPLPLPRPRGRPGVTDWRST